MSNLTVAAAAAFSLAAHEAQQLGSSSIDVEHLFLGLCRVETLRSRQTREWPAGIDDIEIHQLKHEVDAFTSALAMAGLNVVTCRRRMREIWHEQNRIQERFSGHRTPRCRRLFEEAENQGNELIDLSSLMKAVMKSDSQLVDQLLAEVGTTREKVLVALQGTGANPALDTISRFGRDLTKLAQDGKLAKAIGRDDEIKRVARILLQAKKSNPILVGDAGVGKTAVVEGLAVRLLESDIPTALKGLRLVELSLGSLVAGTKYRGDFEERIQSIISECEGDRSIILFIDEIHMLLGAGGAGSSMDAANLLKPALARGSLRCVGATTGDEYRKHFESDAALERRFQVVWIDEPTPGAAVDILDGLRPTFEKHHDVHILSEAVHKAVEWSVRYLPDARLPDKAIDILDQACARAMLSTFTPQGEKLTTTRQEVGVDDIAAVISERCRISIHQLTLSDAQRMLKMEQDLGRRIIGQDDAIAAVSKTVRSAKAGVRNAARPAGVFLFLGPTGVGKTEMAKALAEFLFDDEKHLIRVDMSELAEKHSIAKLIGSPPGYIGHDEGGHLTNKVRTNPYSVVLFDEIEKAHPDVFDLFLQIFDEGALTDSRGRRASFREAFIILTSNIGSNSRASTSKHTIGFVAGGESAATAANKSPEISISAPNNISANDEGIDWAKYESDYKDALARLLRPEIRNRITKEIVFRPLGRWAIASIIDQMIEKMNINLANQDVKVDLGQDGKNVLMTEGYRPEYGARAMGRTISTLIEEPIGRMLLSGQLRKGSRVYLGAAAGAIEFRVT
jgi:ATP-dependent Clp protease ATP-binding subunit ClpC